MELAIRRIDDFEEAIGEEEQAVSPLENNGILADLVQRWQVQSEQGIPATRMLKLAMTGRNQRPLKNKSGANAVFRSIATRIILRYARREESIMNALSKSSWSAVALVCTVLVGGIIAATALSIDA